MVLPHNNMTQRLTIVVFVLMDTNHLFKLVNKRVPYYIVYVVKIQEGNDLFSILRLSK